MAWECFWVEPSANVTIGLRRSADGPCPANVGYHYAVAPLGEQVARRTTDGYLDVIPVNDFSGHPDWPVTCAKCNYVFDDDDDRQVWQDSIWRRVETGEEWPMDELPVGAMFHATWLVPIGVGEDGIALMVRVPPEGPGARSHLWHVDGPGRKDGKITHARGWTREGDPRRPGQPTVSPSIDMGDYHGYLKAGVLGNPL